jgi:triacylglycerol lipase
MIPIILHHGLFGAGSFKGVDRAIASAGHPVFVSSVHPTASIETRARQLREWILSLIPQFGGRRAILLAHSMGGLDARLMFSRLDMAKYFDALVTICTPHRGSPYADWCAHHVGKKLRGFELVRRFGLDMEAIHGLTTDGCARFNEQIADVPGIRYFSVSASRPWRKLPAFGIPSWYIVNRAEGENDGLVSVKSAQWATYLMNWQTDHWHAINQRYGLVAIKAGDISPHYLSLIKRISSPE